MDFGKVFSYLVYILLFSFTAFSLQSGLVEEKLFTFELIFARFTLIAVALTGLFSYYFLRQKTIEGSLTHVLYLVFLGWSTVGFIWSTNTSVYLSYHHYLTLLVFASIILHHSNKENQFFEDLNFITLFHSLILVFCAATFLFNFELIRSLVSSDTSIQVIVKQFITPVGGKNLTAIFLATLLPLQFAMRFKTNEKAWLQNSAIAICAFTILYFGSRSAYLCLVSLALTLLVTNLKSRKLKYYIAGSFALGTAILVLVSPTRIIKQLFHKTLNDRVKFWESTFTIIPDQWLTGLGIGQWNVNKIEMVLPNHVAHPHNDLVRIIAELGVVGILIYALILLSIIALGIANIKKSNHKSDIFLLAGIFIHLLMSQFDQLFTHLNIQSVLFLNWSIIIVRNQMLTDKNQKIYNLKWILLPLLIYIAGLLFFQNYNLLKFQKSMHYLENKEGKEALSELEDIYEWAGNMYINQPLDFLKSKANRYDKKPVKAIQGLEKTLAQYPSYTSARTQLFSHYMSKMQYENAFEQIDKQMVTQPCFPNKINSLRMIRKIKGYAAKADSLNMVHGPCMSYVKSKVVTYIK